MINPFDMTGKTILVTGASSGIGRDTAILLSQLGARVVLVARRLDELLKTQDMLSGENHLLKSYDLAKLEQMDLFIKEIANETNGLDGFVHSAGLYLTMPVRFLKKESVDQVLRLNLEVALYLVKAFRQKGVYKNSSSIVFLSSVTGGVVGRSGMAVYAATKGAIGAISKSLALELARDNIRVNCVAPALVKTEMIESAKDVLTDEQLLRTEEMSPLGIGYPRDVANAIVFLLADTGRWITGTTLVVDGGYTAH